MNILKKIKKDISKAKIIVNNDKTATIKFNTSYGKDQKKKGSGVNECRKIE